MAERIFHRWKQEEEDAFNCKMKKLIKVYEKSMLSKTHRSFLAWKESTKNQALAVKYISAINKLENSVKDLQKNVCRMKSIKVN